MMMMMLQIILLLTESVLVSSYALNSTVQCERPDAKTTRRVRAGESIYLPCPNLQCYEETENSSYVWFRNLSRTKQVERIGTEESERVHYNQSVLYILWLNLNDTGRYITRWWYAEDECGEFETEVVVYEEFSTDLLYYTMPEQKVSGIYCPVCENQQGSIVWYKVCLGGCCFLFWQNFVLIPNQESARVLRIPNSSKESEGIYTCVCTWEHHGIKHNSSGSRRLIIKEQTISSPPKFLLPINNSVVFTDVGSEVILNCSVFFGLTVCDQCSIHWEINGIRPSGLNGYEQKYRRMDGTVQSVLTITEVSESDLRSEFACKAEDSVEVIFVSVTLKSRASVFCVILACICTFLVLLLVGGVLKWFALDLVLFLRQIFVKLYRKEDGKLYDAYVIYQRNNLNEMTSKTVSDFVSGSLLTVLESYYGFKLFIHGRDDLPGEDCINLIETEIQLSRRLIIILTSGASTDKSSVSPEAYDLQVGLHQALVQGATGVILIQLGQMRDYTHLPLGLQHLLCKNSPLLWRDGESSPNSRFWKRVRYQMPVASSCQKSSRSRSWKASFQYQGLLV
ncbi:interleukin-1 receptor-like 1 [Sinocyclocheilus grahami]|uniref:interleukin-1 receptor-like 1 n=1 Tax=Sinocyclocheilus grahami TaxID=75366 RepID=UPI0007AC90C0|nr:PREDICTED: interleukin-1 receptor-like 1 [Sinocyclocheilus grahami]